MRTTTGATDMYGLNIKLKQLIKTLENNVREWGAMEPLGNFVTTTHYVDDNPLRDPMTGRYLAGILHFVKHVSLIWNHRTLNWYSEKTMTTTATNMEAADFGSEMTAADCGSEMTAARICVDLQYLGVQFQEQRCTVLF